MIKTPHSTFVLVAAAALLSSLVTVVTASDDFQPGFNQVSENMYSDSSGNNSSNNLRRPGGPGGSGPEMSGQDPRINFYQQARDANAGAHSAAEEEVPICANLNITDINTCGNYCDDNGYGNGTASWEIHGNVNGTDTSCVCMSTGDLTANTTVCTTPGNTPVMAPAPVGSIPSCISLNITSSDECERACYPEGGLITGVSFSNGFCQCGLFNDMPSFILCEDATPTASPTSNADVTSSVIAGCFALAAMIMHIL